MKITLDLPIVASCTVSACAYNTDKKCHARAITIGSGLNAGCDTFLSDTKHIQDRQRIAGVGACKVTSCVHNEDFECVADEIEVGGRRVNDLNCLTFTPSARKWQASVKKVS